MLAYIIIGLMCNSQECYWAVAERTPAVFNSYQDCMNNARMLKRNSVMFFDTACMVKP